MHMSNKFVLYGGDDAFANRQKKLFDQLSIAEKEFNRDKNNTPSPIPMELESPNTDEERQPLRSCRKRKSETRQFRGKESIFKRPEGPAPRNHSHSIPDYHRNPNKWVKYSLDDVSNDDMTDRSNARTAFAFLKELKARKARENSQTEGYSDSLMESDETSNLVRAEDIIFKKPKQSANMQFKKPGPVKQDSSCDSAVVITPEEKPMFLSSKIIMPEYVVGQRQKKKNKEKKTTLKAKVDHSKELKLNHLEEFDEEDDKM